jgi:hypothetical protein
MITKIGPKVGIFPSILLTPLKQENLFGFQAKDELRSKSDLDNRSFHTFERNMMTLLIEYG